MSKNETKLESLDAIHKALNKEELKPCPFCGGKAETAKHHSGVIRAACWHCFVVLTPDAWNTRPSPWIKITPKTMPKEPVWMFVIPRNPKSGFTRREDILSSSMEKIAYNPLTQKDKDEIVEKYLYYQKITLPEEN